MDVSPVADVLGAMLGKPDFSEEIYDCPLLVVSNKLRVKGASVISYQNTLKTLYEDIVKGTFYVLPSSVHEVLVFPSSRGAENDMQLNDMVQTVNATEVAADDVLSNHAYFFDGEHLVACA